MSPRGDGGGAGPCLDLDTAFPTSHVEVGGGRVAHPRTVGGHTLVFALVRLLAALDLQSPCGERGEGPASQGRPGRGPGGLSQSPVGPVSRSGWAGAADGRAELAQKAQLGRA